MSSQPVQMLVNGKICDFLNINFIIHKNQFNNFSNLLLGSVLNLTLLISILLLLIRTSNKTIKIYSFLAIIKFENIKDLLT